MRTCTGPLVPKAADTSPPTGGEGGGPGREPEPPRRALSGGATTCWRRQPSWPLAGRAAGRCSYLVMLAQFSSLASGGALTTSRIPMALPLTYRRPLRLRSLPLSEAQLKEKKYR